MNSGKNLRALFIFLIFIVSLLFYASNIQNKLTQATGGTKKMPRAEFAKEYNLCVKKYENQQFDEASDCFKELYELQDEVVAKYMYAVSMGFAKNYSEAVSILDEVIKDERLDEDTRQKAKKAYQDFLKDKNASESFDRNDKGNYMGDLSQIAFWEHPNSIKVYIYKDHNKYNEILNAFEKWDSALRSSVDFTFVDSPQSADITARAVNTNQLDETQAGVTHTELFYYTNNKSKIYMKKADIEISYNNKTGALWTDEEFQGIVLHEIGHALGIADHSRHKGDIMYHDVTTYRKGTISNRDINTLRRIYGSIL